ncbi:MAG: sulfatase [Ignavibacteria bacterium]|nr:sulfatase [Ignavibacteria bacterium]
MKQTRRVFLKSVGVGASAIVLSGGRVDAWSGRLPNVILVFTDDQGYGDLGCYGAKGFTTPNIDRMAAEGIRFTNFYVSQAVCSASRAALLTGCYSERVGIQGALGPNAAIGISDGEETIATLLRKRGYATGIFGKWHLGHHREFFPLQHGFDEYFGLPYSNDMWPVGYDGTPAMQGQKSTYPPLPLIDGNEKVDEVATLADQDKLTTRYTERGVRFIEKNKDKPFFLYLPHSMPHVPLGVSGKFSGKSAQGKYGDVIMEIDWSVGEILKTLERLDLNDDTLIIYASDNGPWLNFGNHAGSTGPLREGKGTMWEGGARVPCVIRFPGRIPGAQVCANIASTIDLLPTIAAITGSPLPGNRIDGVDLSPLLEGAQGVNPRDHFFYYYGSELQAVREGKWKLHFPHRYRSYMGVAAGNDGQPGPYAAGETGLELYDLESDVGESVNVADKHPDVVERLQALGQKAREELGDKLTGTIGRGVRQPGRKGG